MTYIGLPVKVKVSQSFVKLLFYALPTGNLLHYTSGRNDVLHVSSADYMNSPLKRHFLSVSFSPRNSLADFRQG